MVKNIFGLLDPRLSDEIAKQGFQTPIQNRSIPRILTGSHERPESEFYRLILENENQFIRTREWWAEAKPQ